jgi:hypothetical protein
MYLSTLLLVLFLQPPPGKPPIRVDPTRPPATDPGYREPKKGEHVVIGLLQRVECPAGRPVRFTLRTGDAVERFEAERLGAVEYIAYTDSFKGSMTCGGRGKGDRVRLTWKDRKGARQAIAIEFLPEKYP